MPVSQMRNGLTAENSLFSQKPSVKVPRSRFDYGRFNPFTASVGAIVPVDCFMTMPNEDYDLSCQYKIDFRPLIVPTLTSYKVKVHYYFCPMSYLWHGWESFISKGRSGKLALSIPQIELSKVDSSFKLTDITDDFGLGFVEEGYYPYSAQSLAGYLVGSVPYDSQLVNDDGSEIEGAIPDHYLPFAIGSNTLKSTGFKTVDVSALPFLMYQKIYRSNYMDPNLLSNGIVESQVWFPDDIDSSDWRIGYAADNLGGVNNIYFVPQRQTIPSSGIVANFVPKPHIIGDSSSTVYDNAVNLLQLRYSMYTDDIFTSALPFLQRGPQTSLDADITDAVINNDLTFVNSFYLRDSSLSPSGSVGAWPAVFAGTGSGESGNAALGAGSFDSGSGLGSAHVMYASNGLDEYDQNRISFVTGVTSSVSGLSVSFTAQQLRSLLALSVWQERNALTNGSYGQFIKVHFDSYPRNQYCEPIYIGGTTSLFNVNAVVQTSASVDGSTPQGNPAGIGGSSNNQSIGRFHSDDWGLIMALMTIIPDTTYVQSMDHLFFDKNPDDFYSPEYEQLSLQPVLNKQLYVSGNETTDNDIFGWSNRYVYLKARESVAHGRFALPATVDAYYHSYVQSRIFDDTPKLSQDFVTVYPPNIDRSMLAYPGEPDFLCQFYSGVRKVSPMSYVTQPNTFGF